MTLKKDTIKKVSIVRDVRDLTVLKAGHTKPRGWWEWILSFFGGYRRGLEIDVALFSTWKDATAYISWAEGTGPRPFGHRFRTDSVLAGYDRAWTTSFYTDLAVNPYFVRSGASPMPKNVYNLKPKENI